MANTEEQHKNSPKTDKAEEGSDNIGGVVVKSKTKENAAAPSQSRGMWDFVSDLARTPVLAMAEEYVWRSREKDEQQRHYCLHKFRRECPKLFKFVITGDLLMLLFILLMIFGTLGVVIYTQVILRLLS